MSTSAPPETQHAPVLVDEVVRWLTPVPAGTWIVDGTVGLGGHAAALLAQTSDSRLLGLDRDAETLALASRRLAPFGARCVLRHADFRHLDAEARACGAAPAHAVLLDLGLSSYQLERSGRGFSFQSDEGLDMRFDRRQPLTAGRAGHAHARARAGADPARIRRGAGGAADRARGSSRRGAARPSGRRGSWPTW